MDYIIVVTAEPEVQRSRVLARPGMTAKKFESILSKQMPDAKKRELADFVIHTDRGEGFTASKAQLAEVLEKIVAAEPDRFERWKGRTFSRKTAQSELPFDVVAFDLDETLVPTMPPVMAAYDAKYAFMETNMPLSLPITRSTLRAQMLKYIL